MGDRFVTSKAVRQQVKCESINHVIRRSRVCRIAVSLNSASSLSSTTALVYYIQL